MVPGPRPDTGFYGLVSPDLRDRIEAAKRIEGVGEEVALLRAKLSEFIDAHPEDMATLLKCVRVIVSGMTAERRMRPCDARLIEKSAQEAINELAAQFLPPPESLDV
jgi:hypothetical protein